MAKQLTAIQQDLGNAGNDPAKLHAVIKDLIDFNVDLLQMVNNLQANFNTHGHVWNVTNNAGVEVMMPNAQAMTITGGSAPGFPGVPSGRPITIGRPQRV